MPLEGNSAVVDEDQGMAMVDSEKCMGCGVCTIKCPTDALRLVRFERETPFNTSRELYKTIAIENRQ